MATSLINTLTQKDLAFYVSQYKPDAFVYDKLFPLKQTIGLNYNVLKTAGSARVAGDIVARNNTDIAAKRREPIKTIAGDIPKIEVVRELNEVDLYNFRTFSAMAQGDAMGQQAIKIWADDVDFALDGANSRIEHMALRSISTGEYKVTPSTNNGAVSEFGIEYTLKSKGGVQTPWTTEATADPFGNLANVVRQARNNSIYLKYAFMNSKTLAMFALCESVRKMCAGIMALADVKLTPSLEDINTALKRQPQYFGLQIVEVAQNVATEGYDGTRIATNPFIDGVVMFSESEILGSTMWSAPLDTTTQGAYTATNGCVYVKKYSEDVKGSPREFTYAVANAMPVWANADRCYLIDVLHNTWNPTL